MDVLPKPGTPQAVLNMEMTINARSKLRGFLFIIQIISLDNGIYLYYGESGTSDIPGVNTIVGAGVRVGKGILVSVAVGIGVEVLGSGVSVRTAVGNGV
jgi:hypothetical protein